MSIKGMHLAWIVVQDIKKAIKFYTETIGLKMMSFDEKSGWAEFAGSEETGARLGVAQTGDELSIQPGQNAVMTFTVEDIDVARGDLLKKGAKMKGEIVEIPGIVKLQMVEDEDNNHFQIVQVYNH